MAGLITVGSIAYSGSTMLDVMLGNAANAFSCGEVYAWYRPHRKHHFRIDCPCGQDPCPVWEKLKDVPENKFHAAVAERLGVEFVIDSSKDLCWLLDVQRWAAAAGMCVYNLLLWKDPLELAHSYWKRGAALMYWRKPFVKYYGRILKLGLPFYSVDFGQLLSSPADKLADVCAAVGMEYFPGKERFWEKQHHHLFGNLGLRRQVEARKSTIRPPRSFSLKFETHVGRLSEQIAADAEVQRIIEALRKAEVSSLPAEERARPQRFILPRPYPFWYYALRTYQRFRKYFPKPPVVEYFERANKPSRQ